MQWRVWTAVGLFAIGTNVALGQPAPDDARELAARASDRIRALQREADQLAVQSRSVFNDLRKLELDRAIALQRVAEADAQVVAVTADRDNAAARVKRLEAARDAGTPGVAERLVSIYKRGRGGYARLLLASDDPRAFGRLTRGVAAIVRLDRVRLERLAHERISLIDPARSVNSEADTARRYIGLGAAVAASLLLAGVGLAAGRNRAA